MARMGALRLRDSPSAFTFLPRTIRGCRRSRSTSCQRSRTSLPWRTPQPIETKIAAPSIAEWFACSLEHRGEVPRPVPMPTDSGSPWGPDVYRWGSSSSPSPPYRRPIRRTSRHTFRSKRPAHAPCAPAPRWLPARASLRALCESSLYTARYSEVQPCPRRRFPDHGTQGSAAGGFLSKQYRAEIGRMRIQITIAGEVHPIRRGVGQPDAHGRCANGSRPAGSSSSLTPSMARASTRDLMTRGSRCAG
jgi:hypothetical protein